MFFNNIFTKKMSCKFKAEKRFPLVCYSKTRKKELKRNIIQLIFSQFQYFITKLDKPRKLNNLKKIIKSNILTLKRLYISSMFDVLILGRLQDDEDLAHYGHPLGPFLQGRDRERVRPSSVLHEHDRDGLGSGQGRWTLGQLLLRHAPVDVPGHALKNQRKTS
jgi:hypothetical protein